MSAIGDRNLDKKRKGRRYQEQQSFNADWASVEADVIRNAIEQVGRTGCAIRFGYSRDGGAYAVGIVGDGDPYTVWGASSEEITEKLLKLTDSFAS